MKLLRCHIDNFGKISDLTMDFADGMNAIHEPNAWGKSTLAAFIRVMFYGFDSKKDAQSFDKERTVYMPWQGGTYGGEIDFAVGNRTYRISRTFGKTEKQDVFHIYDLATNLESVDYTNNVGEELFDLDSISFKRSVFIAQNDCTSQTSDAINAKLGNLVENTNDMNNYETAQQRLRQLLNQMSPTRVTGSIKKRKNELTALESEIKSYAAAEESSRELVYRLNESRKHKDEIAKERDESVQRLQLASEESRKNEQRKNYLSLCQEQEQCLQALLPFTEVFPMGVPEERELSTNLALARRYEEEINSLHHLELTEEEQAKYEELAFMFSEKVPTNEAIDGILSDQAKLIPLREEKSRIQIQLEERERESLQEASAVTTPNAGSREFYIGGIMLLIAGMVAEFLGITEIKQNGNAVYILIGGAIVFFFGIILLLQGLRRKKNALKEEKRELIISEEKRRKRNKIVANLQSEEAAKDQEIEQILGWTKGFLDGFHVSCEESLYDQKLIELKGLAKEYEKLSAQKEQYEHILGESQKDLELLQAYASHRGLVFSEDITGDIAVYQTQAAKYRFACEALETAKQKLAAFEKNTDIKAMLTPSEQNLSLEEINKDIHTMDERLERVRESIQQYTRQLEDMQEQLDVRDERKTDYDSLLELQKSEEEKYDVVNLTQSFLQSAREQFIARYMAPISDAFRKYYNLLLNKADQGEWMIDANITFKKRENGELRETHWLSAGYQDLVGVCMRLALVDAMYQNEKPFLILDDPFVNLDEEKTVQGMELLKEVSKEYQLIYFTCHSSREP